jgi:hypothetical protein
MRKTLTVLFIGIILLTACSKSQPAIVKVDTPTNDLTSEPELIEEVTDNEKVDEFIEFPLDDEVVRVNLKQIPILRAYLQASKDPKSVIEKMKIERLYSKENNDIYLLEFSCTDMGCSYLLLDESTENTGFLLADLASYETSLISPDESRLLVKFTRNREAELPLSDVVVIDLINWQSLSLKSEEINYSVLDFSWPISAVTWIDDDTVSLSVPEMLQSSTEDGGNHSGKPKTTTIQFQVTNKK